MSPEMLIVSLIVVPLIGALLISQAGRWPNVREAITLVTAASLFGLATQLIDPVVNGAGASLSIAEPIPGLEIAFDVEPLGLIFTLLASLLWFVTSVYGIGYMRGGNEPRDINLGSGDSAVIKPGVEHRVEPATDATFYIQFYRTTDAPMIPGTIASSPPQRSGPWEHSGRDLDTADQILEMVTRQYVDVVQDELLEPYFNFTPGFIDWQGHIESVSDYWCHVLLYAPGYDIDVIEAHRTLHDTDAFTPELFDRWLDVFNNTIDDGWTGPHAEHAKKKATGMAWTMAQRFLGKGIWRPVEHR
jgi:truncated hemoglobin YjbI